MKYTKDSLEAAINYLLPTIAETKSKGANFNLPDLCKMAACDGFVNLILKQNEQGDFNFKQHYNTSLCQYVVADALHSLNTFGEFKFGERNIFEEVTF